jgi:hypothetical protein
MSGNNAPPGGGPSGTVIASTAQLQQQNVPVVADANKPVVPPEQTASNAAAIADPNALNLEPVTVPQTAASPAHTEVPDFGDNGLNIAADYFVNTLGLDINGRELTEAAKGNFALLEAKIEVLGDKAKGAGPISNSRRIA